jgi:hypothetical protein
MLQVAGCRGPEVIRAPRVCLSGEGNGGSIILGLVVEDTAANVRPHHPGDIAAAAILLDRGWGKAKEMHEHSGQS